MRRISWKLLAPLVALVAVGATIATASATASRSADEIKVAIMTDCKGAFGGAYELTIAGAETAFAQWTGARPKDPKKPSAGMAGGAIGNKAIKIVGYGCGDETPALALKETRRLVEQLGADVFIGPLSGDEGVAIANYAKTKQPGKTFVNGTSGAQQTTLRVQAPNFFRYNGDGAMWNAGIGQLAYNNLKWRKVAMMIDDYSFGYTSAAGMIADFCAYGGQIVKRVFVPSPNTDYSSYVQQLPPPDQVDGYFWVVGGSGTGASLKAYEQAYGPVSPNKFLGNIFFWSMGNFAEIAPKFVGAYAGGFGTAPGLNTPGNKAWEKIAAKWYPAFGKTSSADGFFANYYNNAWALINGLKGAKGVLVNGQKAVKAAMPKSQVQGFGKVTLDANRQAIQDQYPVQIVKGADGKPTTTVIGLVPQVNQTFGGTFSATTPPPSRTSPACKTASLPWKNKLVPVKNGVIQK